MHLHQRPGLLSRSLCQQPRARHRTPHHRFSSFRTVRHIHPRRLSRHEVQDFPLPTDDHSLLSRSKPPLQSPPVLLHALLRPWYIYPKTSIKIAPYSKANRRPPLSASPTVNDPVILNLHPYHMHTYGVNIDLLVRLLQITNNHYMQIVDAESGVPQIATTSPSTNHQLSTSY
jgi:hypothetical protein